jgi:hypothetical protein
MRRRGMTLAPAQRTAAFRADVAAALRPLGFRALAQDKRLKRPAGRGVVEEVAFGSSHRNGPNSAVCWVALIVKDSAIAAVSPRWQAGGNLDVEPFADLVSFDLVEPGQPERLLTLVLRRLSFFDLLRDAPSLLAAASRGPVPGLLHPSLVVPYLRVRLGVDAVRSFAEALLAGRPELWPGFLGGVALSPDAAKMQRDDGAQLGVELARHGAPGDAQRLAASAPPRVVVSTRRDAASLRSHMGLQLRAWGEAHLTPRLARLDDEAVLSVYAEQGRHGALVDAPERLRVLLQALGASPAEPRLAAPSPRFFQYLALAAPYGRPGFDVG